MPLITIVVEDILTDPDHPVDLSTLPSSDAADHIRQLYSFQRSIESISTEGDFAAIVVGQESPYREDEALRTAKTAGRAAERGNYQAASYSARIAETCQEAFGSRLPLPCTPNRGMFKAKCPV